MPSAGHNTSDKTDKSQIRQIIVVDRPNSKLSHFLGLSLESLIHLSLKLRYTSQTSVLHSVSAPLDQYTVTNFTLTETLVIINCRIVTVCLVPVTSGVTTGHSRYDLPLRNVFIPLRRKLVLPRSMLRYCLNDCFLVVCHSVEQRTRIRRIQRNDPRHDTLPRPLFIETS